MVRIGDSNVQAIELPSLVRLQDLSEGCWQKSNAIGKMLDVVEQSGKSQLLLQGAVMAPGTNRYSWGHGCRRYLKTWYGSRLAFRCGILAWPYATVFKYEMLAETMGMRHKRGMLRIPALRTWRRLDVVVPSSSSLSQCRSIPHGCFMLTETAATN